MKNKIILVVAFTCLISGCGSDSGSGEKVSKATAVEKNCSTELDNLENSALKLTEELFGKFATSATDIWTDRYRLDKTPILYVRREGNADGCALLLNYPAGDNLAGASAVRLPKDTNFDNVLRINKIPDDINKIDNFDFQYDLYGIKTFVMKVNSRDIDIGSINSEKDWMLFVAHEGMHNYQYTESFNPYRGIQDVEKYQLNKESIELILLEQAILNDIAKDTDAGKLFSDISTSVFQLIAVRDVRYQKFPESKYHDLYQEQHEGTAKYVEHRLGTLINNEHINSTSFYQEYNEVSDEKIRDQLAFMRFYFSGSMISKILDVKGVENWQNQVEQGKSPYEILSSVMAVSEAEKLSYLAQAKVSYGYDELAQRAEKLAEIAAKEPTNIFD